jgi:vacuolar-type H+-ATPase subunit F/Vma7
MEKQIAVLADPELADAMRLAGVRRTRALRAAPGAASAVDEALREWLAAEDIGVIVIGADHAELARGLIASFRKGKRISPIIVEVPSQSGSWQADATQYYQQLGREFLGLEIMLQDDGSEADDSRSGTA